MLAEVLLGRKIRIGTLHLVYPSGKRRIFGSGAPEAEWIIHRKSSLQRVARSPGLALGETYMEGLWEAGKGGMLPLLEVLMRNFPERNVGGLRRALSVLSKTFLQWNPPTRSRRNVAHHYDLDEWLFRHFLDRELHYSCAYFAGEGVDLETAQQTKCRHIATKLRLSPGQRVLDIGCGWGGMALYLAQQAQVRVVGLTLSEEQLAVARRRAAALGLEQLVEFRLQDYREHQGRYDRIVSIGMFEHVGLPHFRTYFRQIRELLTDDGVALLHTIGSFIPSQGTNPWIRRYIFPGGYIPPLSEICGPVEECGLLTADVEVLRLHYAVTLGHWRSRFLRNRAVIAQHLDEHFCRMWEFYLAVCEAAFRWRNLAVFQLQLCKAVDTLPLTRDYMYLPAEQRLEQRAASTPARAMRH